MSLAKFPVSALFVLSLIAVCQQQSIFEIVPRSNQTAINPSYYPIERTENLTVCFAISEKNQHTTALLQPSISVSRQGGSFYTVGGVDRREQFIIEHVVQPCQPPGGGGGGGDCDQLLIAAVSDPATKDSFSVRYNPPDNTDPLYVEYSYGPIGIVFTGSLSPGSPVIITASGLEFELWITDNNNIPSSMPLVCESFDGVHFNQSEDLGVQFNGPVEGCVPAIENSGATGVFSFPFSILVTPHDVELSTLAVRTIVVTFGDCNLLESLDRLQSAPLNVTGSQPITDGGSTQISTDTGIYHHTRPPTRATEIMTTPQAPSVTSDNNPTHLAPDTTKETASTPAKTTSSARPQSIDGGNVLIMIVVLVVALVVFIFLVFLVTYVCLKYSRRRDRKDGDVEMQGESVIINTDLPTQMPNTKPDTSNSVIISILEDVSTSVSETKLTCEDQSANTRCLDKSRGSSLLKRKDVPDGSDSDSINSQVTLLKEVKEISLQVKENGRRTEYIAERIDSELLSCQIN